MTPVRGQGGCNAIGVSVALHPRVARSVFARIFPCETVTGGGKIGATGSFFVRVGGVQRDTPATSLKVREFAATMCARHCVARLGSQHVCATN